MYKLLSVLLSVCIFTVVQANAAPPHFDAADTAHFYTAPDGVRIYYETHGSGYPVLLVHGFMGNCQSWKTGALFGNLLAAGYQVILVDLRGNGISGRPKSCGGYANDAEAKDLMGIITDLDIHRYTALGYSRGSIIAARLLVLDERVEQAVIGGMGTGFTNPDWPRRVLFYKALSGENVPELADMVANVKKNRLDITALACQQREQPSTSLETLASVRKRVLVICGDKDSDNGNAKQLSEVFAQSNFVTVPGDHGEAAQTAAFADAVLDWLKG